MDLWKGVYTLRTNPHWAPLSTTDPPVSPSEYTPNFNWLCKHMKISFNKFLYWIKGPLSGLRQVFGNWKP